ncbi:MAG: hypothetical protein A2W33_09010 [Chloroflexi bacterium RBG_16_52_11]|nr:MAG: hypothetical protein A2W33_09010 [Chloroflexi bacterium RBG_16_52_11]
MLRRIKGNKGLKLVIQGSPLVAIVYATFILKPPIGQQFLILITFLWIQVFFISEYFFTRS